MDGRSQACRAYTTTKKLRVGIAGAREAGSSERGREHAKLLADLVRTDRHNHRAVAGDSDEVGAVRILARAHQQLVWDRTRQINRLRNALREYFPGTLEAFPELALRRRRPMGAVLAAGEPGRAGGTSCSRPKRCARPASRDSLMGASADSGRWARSASRLPAAATALTSLRSLSRLHLATSASRCSSRFPHRRLAPRSSTSPWVQVFGDEKLTTALLDRLGASRLTSSPRAASPHARRARAIAALRVAWPETDQLAV